MGYFIKLTEADFTIPNEKLDSAYLAMCELNRGEAIKRGGRFGGGRTYERWFSWMPEHFDVELNSAQEIFETLGFEVSVDDEGLHLLDYDDKSGQEDFFLIRVAPYVKDGSHLVFVGEDDKVMEFYYANGQVECERPYYPWESPYARKGEEPAESDLALQEELEEIRCDA